MVPQQFVGELMVSMQVWMVPRVAHLRVLSCAENRSFLRSGLSSMRVHSVSRLAAMARGPTTMVVDNISIHWGVGLYFEKPAAPPSKPGDFYVARSRLRENTIPLSG